MLKYFKTKHEKDSAKLTALIMVLLILLIFIVGPKYMDPPEEYGIAVNFGTTDFGSGKVQPKEPIKSEPINNNEQPKVQESQPEPANPKTNTEEVLTEDNAEAIAIKKAKEAEARKKAEAEAKAKAEAERIERERRLEEERLEKERKAQEAKRNAVNDMIGGIKNSTDSDTGTGEGEDNIDGVSGNPGGKKYGSFNGIPGSGSDGVGYGLNGRGVPEYTIYDGCENEYGTIVVEIVVDRNGKVISATSGIKGSTNATACLNAQAKKIALSYKWPKDSNAPIRQYGKVVVKFSPN